MRFRGLLRFPFLPQLLVAAAIIAPGNVASVRVDANVNSPAVPHAAYSTITPDDIGAHIAAMQGPRSGTGSETQRAKLNEVAGYIRNLLTGYGLNVSEDPVTFAGQTFPNIVGSLRGTTCPEKTFIVGTHYDGVSAGPAADDDASGVAAMLEIARMLSAQPLQASVDFAAFSFEEAGMVGSTQMAEVARSTGRDLVGMFSLEMVGYTCDVPGCQSYPAGIEPPRPTGDFLSIIGNANSTSLLNGFASASAAAVPGLIVLPLEVPGNGETLPDVRRSDHAPFWDRGYQALLVTDTANLRNPNYHQAGDTLDTLNLQFAADVSNAALATVVDTLTADTNGDGRADVCGTAAVGGKVESPQPQISSESKKDGSSSPDVLVFVILAAGGIAALALAGGLYVTVRSRR